jgi:hypothetical protein
MQLPGTIPREEPSPRPWQLIMKLEGWLGAFWATVITLGFAGLLGQLVGFVSAPKKWEVATWFVLVILWVVLELPFLWRVWTSAMRGHMPLALYVAARQPLRPFPFNLIIGVWWLGHFVVGMFAAYFVETQMVPSAEEPAVAAMVGLLMVLFYSFAANIYLAHAVAAVTRGPIVEVIWRYRALFDLMLSVVAMLAVFQKRL